MLVVHRPILSIEDTYYSQLFYKTKLSPFFSQRGCELDRFLTEFKRYLQVQVRVLRILFFEFNSSSAKMTEFEFKFEALDFVGRNGMNK